MSIKGCSCSFGTRPSHTGSDVILCSTPPCRVAQGGSRPEENISPWMEPEEEEDTGQQGEQVRPTPCGHSTWTILKPSIYGTVFARGLV